MVERIAQLESQIEWLTTECEEYRSLYLKALEQCRKLELGILGQKAERLEPGDAQLTLSILNALLSKHSTEQNTEQTIDKQSPIERDRCKPTGRKPLPEHLPRVDIEILPDEVKRDGLNAFETIGQEVTETLERRAASLVVVRITHPTFVRKDREKNAETEVYRGETAELPIERGLAGPELLAQTLVQRGKTTCFCIGWSRFIDAKESNWLARRFVDGTCRSGTCVNLSMTRCSQMRCLLRFCAHHDFTLLDAFRRTLQTYHDKCDQSLGTSEWLQSNESFAITLIRVFVFFFKETSVSGIAATQAT